MGQDSGTSSGYHVPRLLAFYQDLWDDDGTALGWRPVAWGLRFADGSAISINVEGKPSVTLWHSLEDAAEALDAYVDTPEPRTHFDRPRQPPLPPPPPPAAGPPPGRGDPASVPFGTTSDAADAISATEAPDRAVG
jgi:hypothetical protein